VGLSIHWPSSSLSHRCSLLSIVLFSASSSPHFVHSLSSDALCCCTPLPTYLHTYITSSFVRYDSSASLPRSLVLPDLYLSIDLFVPRGDAVRCLASQHDTAVETTDIRSDGPNGAASTAATSEHVDRHRCLFVGCCMSTRSSAAIRFSLVSQAGVCVRVIVGACERQGKVLAKYLEYNHKSVKLAGKRVLELGSGA